MVQAKDLCAFPEKKNLLSNAGFDLEEKRSASNKTKIPGTTLATV